MLRRPHAETSLVKRRGGESGRYTGGQPRSQLSLDQRWIKRSPDRANASDCRAYHTNYPPSVQEV